MMRALAGLSLTATLLPACGGAAATPSAPLSKPAAPTSSAAANASAGAAPYSFITPYTAPSAAFAAMWVAADENVFPKHAIQATVNYMDTNVASSALLSGEVDISPTPTLVGAMLQGADATFIAKLVSAPVFSLYASKDVQRVADLKGKVIADTPVGSAPDASLRDLLKRHGLKSTDVRLVHSPNPGTVLAAMQAGRAVAAILSAPVTVQAKQAGFVELANSAKEDVPGLQAALVAKKSKLNGNKPAFRAYLDALKEATALMRTNPARAKQIIGKYAKIDPGPLLDESYEAFAPYWQVSAVRPDDVAALLAESTASGAANADPSKLIDASVVQP